jgi:mannitol/fructose-specific phosphotransferase system IIA component (Ntr-type)
MLQLRDALTRELCLLHLEARDIDEVFSQTLDLLVDQGLLAEDRKAELQAALMQREELISTAIGHSVGVPHAYMDAIKQPTVVFVRLEHPMNLGAPDGIATRFLFVLLGPSERGIEHLDTLTNIARLMSDEEFRYEAGEARSPQEIIAALDHFEERTRVPAAPSETAIPEGLRYTGKLFGGIVGDFKRRIGHYGDDFRQGLHPKCVGASLFLFFACLAPTVNFGGLMPEITDGNSGDVELMIAKTISGVISAI